MSFRLTSLLFTAIGRCEAGGLGGGQRAGLGSAQMNRNGPVQAFAGALPWEAACSALNPKRSC